MGKKKQEPGHEPAGVDPFDLSKEDFEAKLAAEMSAEDTEPEDTPETEPADTPPEPAEAHAAPTTDQDSEADTQPTGEPDQPPAEKPASAKLETIEIVHNGQVHRLTRDEAVKLAQKGFDYDTKIGKHQRMAALLDADPEAARVLNDYVLKRTAAPLSEGPRQQPDAPALKPLSEFEDETAWLEHNVKALSRTTGADGPPVEKIEWVLMSRDVDHYHEIAPLLDTYIRKLPMEHALMIDAETKRGNILPLVKFYDKVKEHVLSQRKPQAPDPKKTEPPKQPAFRAKPGGGEPPRNPQESPSYVWDLPNKDFRERLQQIKGY